MSNLTEKEREVLTAASQGAIVPMKSQVDEFKSLISKKLIEHIGNNKYKASKAGLTLIVGGDAVVVEETPKAAPKKVSKPVMAKKTDFSKFKKPQKTWEERDAEYAKKYKHYVKGSLSKSPESGTGKFTATVRCDEGGTRKVYTSDIFQVHHQKGWKGETAKAKAPAKKAVKAA